MPSLVLVASRGGHVDQLHRLVLFNVLPYLSFSPTPSLSLTQSLFQWTGEGPDAFIKIGNARDAMKAKPKLERKATRTMKDAPEDDESDESDDGSEDDYGRGGGRVGQNLPMPRYVPQSMRFLLVTLFIRLLSRDLQDVSPSLPRNLHQIPSPIDQGAIARRGAVSEKASAKRSKGPLHSPVVGDAAAAFKTERVSPGVVFIQKGAGPRVTHPPVTTQCASTASVSSTKLSAQCLSSIERAEKRTFASASFDLAENGIETETEKPNFELTDEENKEIEQNVSAFRYTA